MRSRSPDATLQALRGHQPALAVGGLVRPPVPDGAPQTASIIRDPDGHALQVVGP